MEGGQDIYSGRKMEWRWVLVGTLIMLGMQSLLAALAAAGGAAVGGWATVGATTTLAFLLGGMVIGVMSPGYTAWEAGFSSVLAAGGMVLVASRLLSFGGGLVVILPLAVLWGLLFGLAGGWVGERIQSRAERPGA
jgi:hypothetical protein